MFFCCEANFAANICTFECKRVIGMHPPPHPQNFQRQSIKKWRNYNFVSQGSKKSGRCIGVIKRWQMHWSDKVEVGRTSSRRPPNHTSRIFQLSHQLPLITLYHLYKDS